MAALVLDAFATRQRSSRAIERHCRQDVACGVITGNLIPDDATIARFICRPRAGAWRPFGDVPGWRSGGAGQAGVVSIDGTRIAGNAARRSIAASIRSPGADTGEASVCDRSRPRTSSAAIGRGDELREPQRTAVGPARVLAPGEARATARGRGSAGRRSPRCRLSSKPRPSSSRGRQRDVDAWLRQGKRLSSSGQPRDHADSIGRRSSGQADVGGRAIGNQTTTSSGVATRPTSITARPRATEQVGGRAAARSRIGRRSCRRGKRELQRPGLAADGDRVWVRAGLQARKPRSTNSGSSWPRRPASISGRDFAQLDTMVTATLATILSGPGSISRRGGRQPTPGLLERAAHGRGRGQHAHLRC